MTWTNGTMTPNRLRGTWHESLIALALAAALTLVFAPTARAQTFQLADIPEDGPVTPSFAPLDSFVRQHMATNQISAMTVAVMQAGRIMYMRGFGWHDYYSATTAAIRGPCSRTTSCASRASPSSWRRRQS